MFVNKEFLRTVLPLGLPNERTNEVVWIGSAFLVGMLHGTNEAGEPIYKAWLVTAKHLLRNQKMIVIGLNSSVPFKAVCCPVTFEGNKGWHCYSEDDPLCSEVDIAVLPLHHQFLQHFNIGLPVIQMDKHLADRREIEPGQIVLSMGYPIGLVESGTGEEPNRYTPIVRLGVISRVPAYHIDQTNAFLVDLMNSNGNSGGPVILGLLRRQIDGVSQDQLLAGILGGFLPDSAPLTDKKSKVSILLPGHEGQVFHPVVEQNSGLAIAESAHHIVELITSYPHDSFGLSWEDVEKYNLLSS